MRPPRYVPNGRILTSAEARRRSFLSSFGWLGWLALGFVNGYVWRWLP